MKKAVIWLINLIDHILPKRDKIVLRGYPDVEDQCLAVLRALARRSHAGTVIWVMRSVPPRLEILLRNYDLESLALRVHPAHGFAALWHFLTARLVCFTHGTYSQGDWGNYPPPRAKTIVNMWHGMPIKTIWRLLPKALEPPKTDVLLATSPQFQQIMAAASGMHRDQVWVCGLPRNDMLHYRSTQSEEAIRQLVGAEPWLLYLPTYRKSKEGYLTEDGQEHDSVLSMSIPEEQALDRWLQAKGFKLMVKAHPMSIHAGTSYLQKTDHIVIIGETWLEENALTLYGLAGYSAGLITDLSSIAVDYLLLDRPVFIYFPDHEIYLQGRGTVFDKLDEHLPGRICPDVASLIDEMDAFLDGDDRARDQRARLRADWHSVTSPGSADRLLDALGFPPGPAADKG